MNKLIISSVLLASFSTHAGVDADAVKMANNVGFTKCNTLIKSTFDNANSAKERRVNIRYFPEKSKDDIDIDMTYGSTGDTVIQSVRFSQSGGYCYASSTAIITQEEIAPEFLIKIIILNTSQIALAFFGLKTKVEY